MPCEYWLSADKRTRQYFIKQPSLGWDDTTGGQTWTFSGDSSRFIWVCDVFSEAAGLLGDDYNADTGYWHYGTHRYPNLNSSDYYTCRGMNAKRLKNDRAIDIGIAELHSNNDDVPQNLYDASAQGIQETTDPNAPKKVIYDENGWTIDPSQEQGSSSTPIIPDTTYEWENNGWTGWYEKNEIVKCVADDRWYKRTWAPAKYSPSARFVGAQPYWSVEKRQRFPNPSPFLCERPAGMDYSTSTSGALPEEDMPTSNWCTSRPYDNDDDNRRHLLHWQYALYFNLARSYPQEAVADQRTLRKRFFMYSTGGSTAVATYAVQCNDPDNPNIDERYVAPHESGSPYSAADYIDQVPADWETTMEEWMESEDNQMPTIDDEDAVFDEWISKLGSSYFFKYEDRQGYWVGEEGYETEILPSQIRSGGKYAIIDEYGTETIRPLPPPTIQSVILWQRAVQLPDIPVLHGILIRVDGTHRRRRVETRSQWRYAKAQLDAIRQYGHRIDIPECRAAQ